MSELALLGFPLSHSISPAMMNAAFTASGLPHRYAIRETPDAPSFARALADIQSGALFGANVTLPHKQLAIASVPRATEDARLAGAANVLGKDLDGSIVAHNTDVGALRTRIERGSVARGAAVVLGAGGAARAALVALGSLGFSELVIVARDVKRARPLESLGATILALGTDPARRAIARSDVLVQATSAGTAGLDSQHALAAAIPWTEMHDRAFVIDLVYRPIETEFVAIAHNRGLAAEAGLGMLIGQAERAFEIWTGRPPPEGVMERAAVEALACPR